MYCKKCGSQIPKDANNCINCGEKIEKKNKKILTYIIIGVITLILGLGIIFGKDIYKFITIGKNTIAIIDGKRITYDEIKEKSYGEDITNTMLSIVDNHIANREIKMTDKDNEYVKEVVDYYIEYAEYYQEDLHTFLNNYVGLQGITTEKEFTDYVRNDYKKTLTAQKVIGNKATAKELKEHYKENFSEKLTVKHILIEINDMVPQYDAYNKALSLIETLNNTPKDQINTTFDELALNNSDDTATYTNGGLIESFSAKEVEEKFFEASKNLKDNEYSSEPVKTDYGFHIILKISSEQQKEFKDVIKDVKKSYAEEKLSNEPELTNKIFTELRKKYKLVIKDEEISKKYQILISE